MGWNYSTNQKSGHRNPRYHDDGLRNDRPCGICHETGSGDFITKPINPDYLMQVINRVSNNPNCSEKYTIKRDSSRRIFGSLRWYSAACFPPSGKTTVGLHFRYEPLWKSVEIIWQPAVIRTIVCRRLYDVTGMASRRLAGHHAAPRINCPSCATQEPHEIIQKINFTLGKIQCHGFVLHDGSDLVDAERGLLTAVNAGHPDI
jgi:hypothetical protein